MSTQKTSPARSRKVHRARALLHREMIGVPFLRGFLGRKSLEPDDQRSVVERDGAVDITRRSTTQNTNTVIPDQTTCRMRFIVYYGGVDAIASAAHKECQRTLKKVRRSVPQNVRPFTVVNAAELCPAQGHGSLARLLPEGGALGIEIPRQTYSLLAPPGSPLFGRVLSSVRRILRFIAKPWRSWQ